MSQKRKWMVRAGAETLAAVGLGLGFVGGYETSVEKNQDAAAEAIAGAVFVEYCAAAVILSQFKAEKKNKDYLEIQKLVNRGVANTALLHYYTAIRNELLGNLENQVGISDTSQSEPTQIPDVFRDAFKDFDEKNDTNKSI